MRHKSIFLKLLTSYLITGFFSLGISSVFIFIRDSALNTAILKPLQTIFLWPLNIFSQNSLFDRQSSQVWWILNFSTAIFFIILAITSIKKKYQRIQPRLNSFRKFITLRWGRDSNSRVPKDTGFQDRRFKPLSHPTLNLSNSLIIKLFKPIKLIKHFFLLYPILLNFNILC